MRQIKVCCTKILIASENANPCAIEVSRNLPSCISLMISTTIDLRSSEICTFLCQICPKPCLKTLIFSFSTFSLYRTQTRDGPRTHIQTFLSFNQANKRRDALTLAQKFAFCLFPRRTRSSLNTSIPKSYFWVLVQLDLH